MTFCHDSFVEAVRAAASGPDATQALRVLLKEVLADPEAVAAAVPAQAEDEVLLFEDDTVSIWNCRFHPDVVMPPHEHKMNAHIGVFRGAEKNILFRREEGTLRHTATKTVCPGEVFTIGPEGVHAVTGGGGLPSQALHVYQGPLTQVKRGLFDWDTGAEVDFTMENFDRMKRRADALPDYR